jgi:hypothetical protein
LRKSQNNLFKIQNYEKYKDGFGKLKERHSKFGKVAEKNCFSKDYSSSQFLCIPILLFGIAFCSLTISC